MSSTVTIIGLSVASILTAAGMFPLAQAVGDTAAAAVKWTALSLALGGCAGLTKAVIVMWNKLERVEKSNEERMDRQEEKHRDERENAEIRYQEAIDEQRTKHEEMLVRMLDASQRERDEDRKNEK